MAENFLERLAKEWYEYRAYFVRNNVKFGRLVHGGWKGEIDLLLLSQNGTEAIHIETSSDARTWMDRRERIKKKFDDAATHYAELLPTYSGRVHRIAIIGTSKKPKEQLGLKDVEEIAIPTFIKTVTRYLLTRTEPMKSAIPEHWPLLRAIQYASHWGST